MTELKPIHAENAMGLSFALMRIAYLELAHTLLSIDQDRARELLAAVECRIDHGFGASAQNASGDPPEETPLAIAAARVRSVFREALEQ